VYIRFIIRRYFHRVSIGPVNINGNLSILMVANHFSWWDGFLLYHVNKLVLKKRFHIMVLEDSMRKMGFLKYLGAFSVAKNSKQVIQSIHYAAHLLHDPQNMVVIFPQGKLYSNFVADVNLEQGISRIAAAAGNGFQYVFAATFVENFEHKKPSAYIYLNTLSVDDVAATHIAQHYKQFYQTAKQQQTSIIV
jgi:1-acyl-sn-glycerol-3-phosphate acyltransferase